MLALTATATGRWSSEKAREWAADKGWITGCDYVPSYAINQIETWQEEDFNPEVIDKELAMAESLGFNTVRIFLSNIVYTAGPEGFKKRFDSFLEIADRHGIRVLPTFWTNGGKCMEARLGKQPESISGIHNSQWVTTPGAEYVNDPGKWGELEIMVKDIIGTYADDNRILMWCLYNEPENLRRGITTSVPLMEATFSWARSCNPSQPLTAPIWDEVSTQPGKTLTTKLPEATFVLENSDVLTFHCYREPDALERIIQSLLPYGRPMVCTEYLRRPQSTFESSMPIFRKYNVGAINFGLVAGKCNFNYPWNKIVDGEEVAWTEEPEIWFHDIFRADGTPWNATEVEFIRNMTGKK